MKKIYLLVAGLACFSLVNAQKTETATTTTTPPAAPDISQVLRFSEENHDFGQIPQGKPVEFDIVIKNVSQDTVTLESVKVGCGCTTPKYEAGKKYGPGDVFKVTLGFNGYATGAFEKYADINFSKGLSKHVRFHGVGYKVPDTPAPAGGAADKLKGAGK